MHASKNKMEQWGLLAGVILLLAAQLPAAEPAGRGRVSRKADDGSFISIQFADKRIPDIHVTGVSRPEPYGTYLSPEEQRAADQVAVMMPPPELAAYALQWDTHEDWDIARLQLAAAPCWDYETPLIRELLPDVAPSGICWPVSPGALQPTPPDAYPLYNLTEYNARLAEWRRGLERAALHGVEPAPQRPAR